MRRLKSRPSIGKNAEQRKIKRKSKENAAAGSIRLAATLH